MTQSGDQLVLEIIARRPAPPGAPTEADLRSTLFSHGITCHPVSFGMVCRGERSRLAQVFGSQALDARPGDSLRAPDPYADLIEQITVPVAPDFFP
jgi:hypothetical protein